MLAKNTHLVISVWGGSEVGIPEERYRLGWISKNIKRYLLRKADLVTTTSRFLARGVKDLEQRTRRLEVVPFGVDLISFNPELFKPKKKRDGVLRVGFFKHLHEVYGPNVLLKAFSRVSKKLENAELFVFGEGELKNDLFILARRLDIDNKVHFLGFVRNVPKVMAPMDITVMPSLVESFGVAAVESQALRIPIVASRVGGVPEVILDGETGFLVPPGDEKSLADRMIKLLSDKNLRRKMGVAGRNFVVQEYNWEESTKKMRRFYKSILIKENV